MEQAPVELLEQLAYGVRARTLLVGHEHAPLRLYCACAGVGCARGGSRVWLGRVKPRCH